MTHRKVLPALALAASALLALLGARPGSAQAQAGTNETRLLRFPDIHGNQVAFSYGGDLWLAPTAGGTATRLTAHPGVELFAKFSPDGKWIAFTGQYDGDEQVYVIPVGGGVPKQLTWYPAQGPLTPRWGYDNQVTGWTPDGKSVVFRSLRDAWDISDSRLFTVPATGGIAEPLPMPKSGAGDISPDGKKVAYSPLARDFRTWKRYQGGWAQDLYIYDLASGGHENFTNNIRTDRDPMWIGDKVYFASDRDGHLNLYAYDPKSKQTAQVTREKQQDVRWPSKGDGGEIVYELGGVLQVLDTKTGSARAIRIEVPTDGLAMRPSRIAIDKNIEGFSLSPKGERVLFVARGDVLTAPIEKGNTRNLTNSSNAHERWARWSPDGARIAYLSDKTGEDELYVIAQDGRGEPEQITRGGSKMRFQPVWSPDGKRIAFVDKDGDLWVVALADKKLTKVVHNPGGEFYDYVWAPDSRYLAFSLSHTSNSNLRGVHVWSLADGQVRQVTHPYFNSFQPAWDPNGNYLYYLAQREFTGQISNIEFNYAVSREMGIFALALRKDVKHPFPPESDEVTIAGKDDKEKKEGDNKDEEKDKDKKEGEKDKDEKDKSAWDKDKPLRIDFEGLSGRVATVPVDNDNYVGLAATGDGLLYGRSGAFFYGRDSDHKTELVVFSFKDRKPTVLADDINAAVVSDDGAKVLVLSGTELGLYDAKPGGKDSKKTISTAGLYADRVPAQEWAHVFEEVWRRYRDYFYVPNMNGYDWKAIGDQYRPLVRYVAHRSDLNYILGEMIAELNTSHAYIAGGDYEVPDRPSVALPGARFQLDKKAGRYRIAEILQGENDEPRYRSPLTEVGIDAKVGDYVLAIDGADLAADDNPYRLLRGKAAQAVELLLNDKPEAKGARRVVFQPIDSETNLIYNQWIRQNREKVSALSKGRVGYLHIPDMGGDGLREFIKWFYPQLRKEGLIVDVRGNGGGNVSEMLIERLRRVLLSTGQSRTSDLISTYPSAMFHGSMVALLSETTASDGDIFSAMFKQAGLGPLIGKRSWGGVVGISGREPLIDGGSTSVPEAGTMSPEGQWIVEGHGVDPDIVVENDPKQLLQGHDQQLERGVEEVLKLIEKNPKKLPGKPEGPDKTK